MFSSSLGQLNRPENVEPKKRNPGLHEGGGYIEQAKR